MVYEKFSPGAAGYYIAIYGLNEKQKRCTIIIDVRIKIVTIQKRTAVIISFVVSVKIFIVEKRTVINISTKLIEPKALVELELYGRPYAVEQALLEIKKVCRDQGIALEEMI